MPLLHDIQSSTRLPATIPPDGGRCTAVICLMPNATRAHHDCYLREELRVFYCIADGHDGAFFFNRATPDGLVTNDQRCPEHRRTR